jgi:hypothetical protein
VDLLSGSDLRLWARQWRLLDIETRAEITKHQAAAQRMHAAFEGIPR